MVCKCVPREILGPSLGPTESLLAQLQGHNLLLQGHKLGDDLGDNLVHIEVTWVSFGRFVVSFKQSKVSSGHIWGYMGEPKKCPDDAMYSKPQVLLCFFDMLKGNMNVHMDAHVVQLTIIEPSHRKHARPYGHACCPYDARAPDENVH